MQTLRQLVDRIDTNRSNLNGSCSSFDNLTIQDLFQCSEPKIYEIIERLNLYGFQIPEVMGNNSLVFYANSRMEDQDYKLAVKISVISKSDENIINSIHKMVSDNGISPKIFYDCVIDFDSRINIIKIIVSERVIPFSNFRWTSIIQKKKSIFSLIQKTLALHATGYVHNDLKYENLGLDEKGNIYIFDFDNFTEITKKSCSKKYSSSMCHPPDDLIGTSISRGLGNTIIDLFSIISIILGDIIGIRNWQFDNEQLFEKKYQISIFNRRKMHRLMQNIISKKYLTTCCSPFWYSLLNFIHLSLQKNSKIINKHAFNRRTRKLIMRMKTDLE